MDLTQHFDWDGREIARDCIGDGPAVVFCHGTPFSSVLWQPFAEALSDRYYASLMLVDVVAIPPSGSPLFQFVQSNPGVLEELPGYIHRAIPTASHLLHYDAPAALMNEVTSWLDRQ